MSGFWFIANRRTDQWIVYWQSRLAAFEEHEHEPVETPVFSGVEYERVSGMYITFNRIVIVLIGFFAFLWVSVLVSSFFM